MKYCNAETGESLNITTWVRGKAPAIAVYRDFLLTDENGTEVIRAEAKFALFDLATSKLTRISEELLGSYQPEDKTVFENSQRLRVPSEYTSETELKLRRLRLDTVCSPAYFLCGYCSCIFSS